RLALRKREGHVVDRLEDAEPREEIRLESVDGERRPVLADLRPRLRFEKLVGHQLRCLGSRMSRSASPSRLVPNTARLMAMPGKMTSHGAVRTYSAADCESMRPQEGNGSGTPRPRNESEASVRM